MENRFAGAQDLGDRRRRRLSGDDPDDAILREFFPADIAQTSVETSFASSGSRSSQLLRRGISPRIWKQTCLLLSLLIIVGAVIWWERAHPAVVGIDGNTTLARGTTGLLLFLSGQLAFLVGWIRSQSGVDFRGRYRWWKWLGVGAVGAGITLVTGTQVGLPDLMASLVEPITGPIRAARPAIVLVPGLLFCVVVLGRVVPDMRRCFVSQSLLVVALLIMTVRLMLVHSSSQTSIQSTTLNAMLLTSAYLSFAAMLLHCRYVAFVCNDPPVDAEQPQRMGSASVPAKPWSRHKVDQAVTLEEIPRAAPVDVPASKPAAKKKSRRNGKAATGKSRKAA